MRHECRIIIKRDTCVAKEVIVVSAKGDKTKELICSESYKLFAEKGFKEVTMKDICEKTGLSRGGLYRHYSSTEEIFSHIINALMQTQENEVLNKMESLVPAKQILLELLNRYQIEMLDSSNCLTLAIYEFFSTLQRKGNENLLYEQYLLSKKTWESLIAYGIKTKEFNEVNAAAIIDIIIFSYQGVRLYSNLMFISPQIPENILYIIKNILLK